MAQKDWGDWSVHARVCITSPLQQEARCSVTLVGAGPHTVTLSCDDPRPTRDAASQTTPKVRRSPARGRSKPYRPGKHSSGSGEGKKNPRTVHIDVYCTASESSSSSEEESGTTAQTVFENDRLRVVHTRVGSDTLPHALQRQKRRVLSGGESSASTPYPSPRTSIASAISDALSLPTTLSDHSTSWKDTDDSLAHTDSFDYENSADRLRIREKERAWAARKEGAENREEEEDEEESSESSDGTELAWSFGRYEELERRSGLKREGTVRRVEVPLLVKSGSLSDTELPLHKPPRYQPVHVSKAERFGAVVGSLRRPGHHMGPSKNPDCSCDTCKYFFAHGGFRYRTRSLGDRPLPEGDS